MKIFLLISFLSTIFATRRKWTNRTEEMIFSFSDEHEIENIPLVSHENTKNEKIPQKKNSQVTKQILEQRDLFKESKIMQKDFQKIKTTKPQNFDVLARKVENVAQPNLGPEMSFDILFE